MGIVANCLLFGWWTFKFTFEVECHRLDFKSGLGEFASQVIRPFCKGYSGNMEHMEPCPHLTSPLAKGKLDLLLPKRYCSTHVPKRNTVKTFQNG